MFTDYLNYRYLVTKIKLNDKEARWIEKLTTFDFTIIYREGAKNPTNGLSRRPDFKDDNELFTTRCQLLPNFLSKFQEHLKGAKSDPVEEQSINSGKTLLLRNVLSLIRILQDINFIRVLLIKSESKSDPAEEQNIDFDEIPLFRSVLNLVGALQGTNFIRVLSAKNKSRDECSNSVSDSIGCNQMRIPHLGLVSIIEENSDQTGKIQFAFVVRVIGREPYIL